METFTHAEGNLDDEVFEKSKSGSDTDVESGLEKLEGRLWFWVSKLVGEVLICLDGWMDLFDYYSHCCCCCFCCFCFLFFLEEETYKINE